MQPGVFASSSPLVSACALAAAFTATPVRADTGYAGTYTASSARIEAQVTTWGPDCGVRPQSYTSSERPKVVVADQGAHLSLAFPDHVLKTNACWTPNSAVKLTSATAADNRWRADCRTAQGDPKKEVGHYTVNAVSASRLELVEESEYDWQLKTSHCTAKVRITQTLERPTPGVTDATEPESAPALEPKEPCTPGALARIRLRPAEARVEPGERLCFQLRGFDAQSCASDVAASLAGWELKKPIAARGTLKDGCFKAADGSADAEGAFRVVATLDGMRAEASITVAAPDLSDITARRSTTSNAEGAPSETTATGQAGVKALGAGSRLPWWLMATLLGAAGVAALLVVFSLGRRRAAQGAPPPDAFERDVGEARAERTPEPERSPALHEASATLAAALPPAHGEPWICPTCRHGHPPGTTRCAKDGDVPIPYAVFVQRAKASESRARSCAHCGAALAADATFCGECGKRSAS